MARFVVLVIDSFGVGAMKDVAEVRPQDVGANTCGHILRQLPQLHLPTLEKLGLINALGYAPGVMAPSASAVWGIAELQHEGGDTFMGHQEILGTRPQAPLRMPFSEVIDRVELALKAAGWQVERRGGELAFLWVNESVVITILHLKGVVHARYGILRELDVNYGADYLDNFSSSHLESSTN